MTLKRLKPFLLALTVGLAPVLGVFGGSAAANGSTFTWTGSGGDSNMNTAANWDLNAVPSTNDKVVFPSGSGTIHDDIPGSVHFQSLSTAGSYSFDGNDIFARSITASGAGSPTFTAEVHLVTDVSTTVPYNISTPAGGGIIFNAPVDFVSGTRYDVVGSPAFNQGMTGGATSIHFNAAGAGGVNGTVGLSGDSSSSSADISVDGGNVGAFTTTGLGSGSETVTVNSGGNLDFALDSSASGTFTEPVVLAGGSLTTESSSTGFPDNPHGSITLSGSVAINADTAFTGRRTDLQLTGPVSGGSTITPAAGTDGNLIIAASGNTSGQANGTYIPATLTTTYSDSNSNTVDVDENNIVVVDGARGTTNVHFGGTLKGGGTVGALHVFASGIVAPGHSPGCLNTGNLTLNGTYQAEIGGTTACSGYDQLNVAGTVDLTGATLNVALSGGFVPAAGQSFTIVNNDGSDPVTGTFNGLAEGASFTSQGVTYTITYQGGDGNDVVLSVAKVAVPGTPDTGMRLVMASPLATLGFSSAAALVILYLSRRLARTRS